MLVTHGYTHARQDTRWGSRAQKEPFLPGRVPRGDVVMYAKKKTVCRADYSPFLFDLNKNCQCPGAEWTLNPQQPLILLPLQSHGQESPEHSI